MNETENSSVSTWLRNRTIFSTPRDRRRSHVRGIESSSKRKSQAQREFQNLIDTIGGKR